MTTDTRKVSVRCEYGLRSPICGTSFSNDTQWSPVNAAIDGIHWLCPKTCSNLPCVGVHVYDLEITQLFGLLPGRGCAKRDIENIAGYFLSSFLTCELQAILLFRT